MTPDEMIHAWANARSDSQRKVIERKITEENARRRKLAEEQQKNSIPVSKKLKQKRSKIPEVEIANLMEKLFKAKTPEEADDIAKQIGRKEKKNI
jgi:3-methyladenine DNA glycosylase AlkC